MKVRGRDFGFSKRDVEQAMRGVRPDTIQKHVVEINNRAFPPKQIIQVVTGWDRLSFTTAEAQRLLTRLGFVCREATTLSGGHRGWAVTDGGHGEVSNPEDRTAALEVALVTVQEAFAGLAVRVRALEDRAVSSKMARGPSAEDLPESPRTSPGEKPAEEPMEEPAEASSRARGGQPTQAEPATPKPSPDRISELATLVAEGIGAQVTGATATDLSDLTSHLRHVRRLLNDLKLTVSADGRLATRADRYGRERVELAADALRAIDLNGLLRIFGVTAPDDHDRILAELEADVDAATRRAPEENLGAAIDEEIRWIDALLAATDAGRLDRVRNQLRAAGSLLVRAGMDLLVDALTQLASGDLNLADVIKRALAFAVREVVDRAERTVPALWRQPDMSGRLRAAHDRTVAAATDAQARLAAVLRPGGEAHQDDLVLAIADLAPRLYACSLLAACSNRSDETWKHEYTIYLTKQWDVCRGLSAAASSGHLEDLRQLAPRLDLLRRQSDQARSMIPDQLRPRPEAAAGLVARIADAVAPLPDQTTRAAPPAGSAEPPAPGETHLWAGSDPEPSTRSEADPPAERTVAGDREALEAVLEDDVNAELQDRVHKALDMAGHDQLRNGRKLTGPEEPQQLGGAGGPTL
jgi:hypothetical protein